jgi:hypothetical protein
MIRRFDFTFEELPLATIGDIEACLINGEATIEYDSSGMWEAIHITVDGYRNGKHVQATAPTMLHAMVLERLYGSWHDKVQEAVSEQLEEARERAADDRADMIRERRADHD